MSTQNVLKENSSLSGYQDGAEGEEGDSGGHNKRMSVLESHGYVLGRTIGKGSYATVKLATSARHKEEVAIKVVIKPEAPKEFLLKFLPREVEILQQLKHPNLIKFLQAIETSVRVYIIMEYAENGNLLQILKKEAYVEEDPRAKKWFSQLQNAMNYCHDEGIVHRDVKCENLLMDKNYNLKLSDFGFARNRMKPKQAGMPILSETFCGSYAYASPEILKGLPYDPMFSDVWSMGVVLFAMVFGKLPFDDSNYKKLLKQVQSKVKFPPEPPVSNQCKSLLAKLMAPIKFRPSVKLIKNDPWLSNSPITPYDTVKPGNNSIISTVTSVSTVTPFKD